MDLRTMSWSRAAAILSPVFLETVFPKLIREFRRRGFSNSGL